MKPTATALGVIVLAAALAPRAHPPAAGSAPHRHGIVEVRSDVAAGSCMDANAAKGNVILWPCHGGSNQKFHYSDDGTLRHRGRCLGANGASLVFKRCDASPDTRWTFAGGEIRNGAQQCIDIAGGDRASGTPLVAWSCQGAPQQRWTRREGG